MSNDQRIVKLLAEREVKDAMADTSFYTKMPEFLPLRSKIEAMRTGMFTPHGCSSCAKNRIYRNLSGSFFEIVQTLNHDAIARLRDYFGADELRATVLDNATKQPKTLKL